MEASTIERCAHDLRQLLTSGSLCGRGPVKLRDNLIAVDLERLVRVALADYDAFYHLPLSRWVTQGHKDELRDDLARLHRLASTSGLDGEHPSDERRQPRAAS
jgi:hypothetical protein